MIRSILALVLSFALLSCADRPSQHDAVRYGTVAVYWSPTDWPSQDRDWFAEELATMAALGPDFTLASSPAGAIVVEHWDSGDGCTQGAADWTPSLRRIRIDPVCTHGELEIKTALGHELGHALGLTHVCRTSGELSACSPVGVGVAVMNPRLSYGDPEITTDRLYDGEIAPEFPHTLDLAEFRRVHP